MLKAVLFDLDGTLLPMDQDIFIKEYFSLLAKKLAPLGYEPKGLIDAVWKGTAAMVENDGRTANESVFWKVFSQRYGEQKTLDDKEAFDDFYRTEFQSVKDICGFSPLAAQTVHRIKSLGLRTALATNPIFPAVATESRIRWAGLSPDEFELCTTYENIGWCKPNLNYYRDILRRMQLAPEECLMVGNDVSEDMVAREIGVHVFLLTDCLINKKEEDISQFPHGSFDALMALIRQTV